MHAQAFLRKALEACTNKPAFRVDKGPWHPGAFRALGLRWEHRAFGEGDRVERWLRAMKARTKRSFNNLLARRKPILKVELFMRSSPYGTTS
jgi:transposase-like protein